MPKQRLNADQYIAEMNRQLLQHELYREGMRFIPYPEGSSGHAMSGYTVTGPFELMNIYAQIAHHVGQQFDFAI